MQLAKQMIDTRFAVLFLGNLGLEVGRGRRESEASRVSSFKAEEVGSPVPE